MWRKNWTFRPNWGRGVVSESDNKVDISFIFISGGKFLSCFEEGVSVVVDGPTNQVIDDNGGGGFPRSE